MRHQERAERTREQIVRAAAVCFDTRGFGATSLSGIVETAKVSKGALYFHFTSKEKLARPSRRNRARTGGPSSGRPGHQEGRCCRC